MDKAKRMIDSYEVMRRIYIGDREVVFADDLEKHDRYMVCYCDYDNPCSLPVPREGVTFYDYLEAMENYVERVQGQIRQIKEERAKFGGTRELFTEEDCILIDRNESIIGKVIVLDIGINREEYQHPAYQLFLAEGGGGAEGGRSRSVFATCLATGEREKLYRDEVIGEIKPEKMPEWAKEKLAEIKRKKEERKKQREAR